MSGTDLADYLPRAERPDQPPCRAWGKSDLRHAVRHAHLARSGQAHEIPGSSQTSVARSRRRSLPVARGALGVLTRTARPFAHATIHGSEPSANTGAFGGILLLVNSRRLGRLSARRPRRQLGTNLPPHLRPATTPPAPAWPSGPLPEPIASRPWPVRKSWTSSLQFFRPA